VSSRKVVVAVVFFTLAAASAVGMTRADALMGVGSATVTASEPQWAPSATAAIHPGVQTFTNGAQCTADYVFSDGTHVYIGQGAHCSGTGGNTETNGCTAAVLPEGTKVNVSGASQPGTIVYNSWVRMQKAHETDANACEGNDFALVRLADADAAKVNPSVPFWGGPVGINTTGAALGDKVYSYGNSELRFGLTELSPKVGISFGDDFGGWVHEIWTATPGIPGDSGSAVLDASGRALGILRTVALAPIPGENEVGDIGRQIRYMKTHTTGTDLAPLGSIEMVSGTQPFAPLV
jgi:hypothetical protein